MALLALISAETDLEKTPPSGWLTTFGLLLLVGAVVNEIANVNLIESLALASGGIDFLSIYLPL
jgi:hypothetical protein